ncbi:hypothetical protein DAEQUDRAFT_733740 [Daedalea quercina L-15889]|uniref:Uncharacterized protein n=1 Tax=Daedalea quercina L-15889 TaxID=1314783 RepID=A0A165KSD6_9APHY|nr:hypothetical protein DAEQUDRAFT_733740 [Daedalea quercina L-15889]
MTRTRPCRRVSSLALAPGDLPLLSSIVRMATKYRLARPVADFHTHVREKWPADLAKHAARLALEQREHRRRTHRIVTLSGEPSPTTPAPTAPPSASVHPAHVIALLRGTGCADRELLAPLFYALTCAPTDARARRPQPLRGGPRARRRARRPLRAGHPPVLGGPRWRDRRHRWRVRGGARARRDLGRARDGARAGPRVCGPVHHLRRVCAPPGRERGRHPEGAVGAASRVFRPRLTVRSRSAV